MDQIQPDPNEPSLVSRRTDNGAAPGSIRNTVTVRGRK